jgi:hypothetical protein
VHPYPIAPTYLTKAEYREKFIEHYQIEDYIDKKRATIYSSAPFRFVDDLLMQRKIARRIMITMEGQKKVNENCLVQIRITYSELAQVN